MQHASVLLSAAVFAAPRHGKGEAAVTLTLVDQVQEQPQHVSKSFAAAVGAKGLGWARFISLQALRARPGYLAGDTLVIRAEVSVLL